MWQIPEAEGADKDKGYEYQGIGIRNLERAVMQGWTPVSEDEKVGTNWPAGPQGYRMFQEQVLCKMPRVRWNELQKEIDETQEVLSVARVEDAYREEIGAGVATGSIKDG